MKLPPLVEPTAELTASEITRYSRHLLLPDVGLEGQKRLKTAKVLVVGAGGLGSPALLYLAAAGVGTLGIVEFDTVDEFQPPAPNHLWNVGYRTTKSRMRRGADQGAQSVRYDAASYGTPRGLERARDIRGL